MTDKESFIRDLENISIKRGDVLLVHSSYKAIGTKSLQPEDIVDCLIECVGQSGTLLMPALSYLQQPKGLHNSRLTQSNVGVIAECFRVRHGVVRSLHPTHSVCAIGKHASELLRDHHLDRTSCGAHSPFRKLLFFENAKILMLGCGLRPNTSMHAVEEIIGVPYLFGEEYSYMLVDSKGEIHNITYRDHGFAGWAQEYDRIEKYLPAKDLLVGNIGKAKSFVFRTEIFFNVSLSALKANRYAFVSQNNA